MFAEKPLFPTSNSPNFYLPPIGKSVRRKIRPPPTPSFPTMAAKAAHIAENVAALKAKYADYNTWRKTSTRHNQEPILTQELLKNSLCQMGIDSGKAEQLVSTCSWYVYQFQKDLKIGPEHKHQFLSIENKKLKQYKTKSKNPLTTRIKDHIEDSTPTVISLDKDDSISSNLLPPIRSNHHHHHHHHHHPVLPSIHVSDSSTSSRFRHVDFDHEQIKTPLPDIPSSHWRSTFNKTRSLAKLQSSLSLDSSNNNLPPPLVDFDLSLSQQNSSQHGLVAGHTRSILRKQNSSSSSITSTDVSTRKNRSRIYTPSSIVLDDIPLGTRSQRLFGGSECFAQIMNELEQQKKIF